MTWIKAKFLLSLLAVLTVGLFWFQPALAHTNLSLSEPIIPESCRDADLSEKSPCGINEFIHTFIHVAGWILAIIGAVALGFFVYGGFTWLTAAGNASRVDTGRRILVGTAVGLIIVLTAFSIVRFIGSAVSGGSTPAGFNKYLE